MENIGSKDINSRGVALSSQQEFYLPINLPSRSCYKIVISMLLDPQDNISPTEPLEASRSSAHIQGSVLIVRAPHNEVLYGPYREDSLLRV
jgi:hypothetical protein